MSNWTDREFLTWLRNRLVLVYGESENVDFVLRLDKIIDGVDESTSLFDGTELLMKSGGQLEEIGFSSSYEDKDRQFRRELLASEYLEYLNDGEAKDNPVEVADGLLDVIVVAWGSLLKYFGREKAVKMAREVNRSNLDKINGKHGPIVKRGDGKILKPEGWVGPRIADIIYEGQDR